jgi:hypothetical protein
VGGPTTRYYVKAQPRIVYRVPKSVPQFDFSVSEFPRDRLEPPQEEEVEDDIEASTLREEVMHELTEDDTDDLVTGHLMHQEESPEAEGAWVEALSIPQDLAELNALVRCVSEGSMS